MANELPTNSQPVYSDAMRGVAACFTRISSKKKLSDLVGLVYAMGGTVHKNMNSEITHLICERSEGDKYYYAKIFGLIIVRPDWIYNAWERSKDTSFSPKSLNFTDLHKLQLFEGLTICFLGFEADEQQKMANELWKNGGHAVSVDDTICSHIVINENTVEKSPLVRSTWTYVVKAEWFWCVLRDGFARESLHTFHDSEPTTPKSRKPRTPVATTPNSRKRKSVQNNNTTLSSLKRRFSLCVVNLFSPASQGNANHKVDEKNKIPNHDTITGAAELSGKRKNAKLNATQSNTSATTFNETMSESFRWNTLRELPPELKTESQRTMRYLKFRELYCNETNYMRKLDAIINAFKAPLEKLVATKNAILSESEIEAVFGKWMPIYNLHERIWEQMRELHDSWNEESSLGAIILEHCDTFILAYKPFFLSYETIRNTLRQLIKNKPKFERFVTCNEVHPAFGRVKFQDVFICAIQRLFQIKMLLNDILCITKRDNADYEPLTQALNVMKEAIQHIDDEKERAESKMGVTEIFQNIEGCPPQLWSLNPRLLCKFEATEISNALDAHGSTLQVYLFDTVIEVCKRRTCKFFSAKAQRVSRLLQHVRLIPLGTVNSIIDIADMSRGIALLCSISDDQCDSELLALQLVEGEKAKTVYLAAIQMQLHSSLGAACESSPPILCRSSKDLGLGGSNTAPLTPLRRALQSASKSRLVRTISLERLSKRTLSMSSIQSARM